MSSSRPSNETSSDENNDHDGEDDVLEKYVQELFQDVNDENLLLNTDISDSDAWSTICQFNDKKPLHTNVLDYWFEKRFAQPLLYKLSCVVLGAPASQVSVERCFSTLKFVLNDYRSRLNECTLEQIMIVKLNDKFNKIR